jgi:hypothetical protein
MTLLHNMSGPPQTQISYRAAADARPSRRMVFALPEGFGSATPERLLRAFDGTRRRGTMAVRDLRNRLNAHAAEVPLPPAALVVERQTQGDEVCAELLTICTVLAKSSDRIYLRDKEPNLDAIRPDRRVIIQLPPDWRKES